MKTFIITKEQALQLIKKDGGKFFGAVFEKADGTIRIMNCKRVKLDEIKGTGTARNNPDQVKVYSNNDKAYRSFNINRLKLLKMGGNTYSVIQ